jgi:hypothetical protein
VNEFFTFAILLIPEHVCVYVGASCRIRKSLVASASSQYHGVKWMKWTVTTEKVNKVPMSIRTGTKQSILD